MGAISALKGFRVQFLYSLYKILSEYEKGFIYQPEGIYEDLDIIDDRGNYIEIIQIKNKSNTLQFSDLFSKETSFFKRAEKVVNNSKKVVIKIVSFGEISNELKDKEILSKKLVEKGFDTDVIKAIVENFQYEIVNYEVLTSNTLELLKSTSLFSDSKVALELLIYWIYKSGEESKSIQAKELIFNLEKIGGFINEQSTFNKSYNNTILPFSLKSLENENLDLYRENFYLGVSAKFEHILANLDVLRENKLSAINNEFKESNIVFVYGASGQGKSTLAYRFIKEFSSDCTAYELKISESIQEIFETIDSLESLCKGLKFPLLLYIDVKPQNSNWNEIVKELYGKKNLKFLITIRQEEWNRTNNLEQYYNFRDIELTFDKIEAKYIYESLSEFKVDLKFTDFEESWSVFGNGGLLLEYVYLINQGNTLKSRLNEQVNNIRNRANEKGTDELEVLKLVSLADTFNSKISYKEIINFLGIKAPIKYINDLQKEYLLQYSENKEYLIGLHPIRSNIMCEILFDEDPYTDVSNYISISIGLIDESDLHEFLLHSFDKGYSISTCLTILKEVSLKSWSGYKNVANALLWKGAYDYVFQKNINAFNALRGIVNDSWSIVVPFDFSGVSNGSIYDIVKEFFSEEIKGKIEYVHKDFTPKEDVFEYLIEWLNIDAKIQAEVNTVIDIKSLGELLFWINHLKIEKEIIFNEDAILKMLDDFNDIEEEMSTLLNSMLIGNHNEEFTKKLTTKLLEIIRIKYNLISFVEEVNNIDCNYFYNPLNYNEEDFKEKGNFFNDMSVKIITLFRNIFPDKDIFSTQGIAMTNFGFSSDYNPTIKGIDKSKLPLPFLTNINSLIINLYNFQYLPDSWGIYVEQLNEKRKRYNEATLILIKSFSEYFRTNDLKKFIKPLADMNIKIAGLHEVKLPKMTNDRWGYNTEPDNNKREDSKENISASINKYKPYLKHKQGYFSGIDNFLRQIENNLFNVLQSRNHGIINEDYNPNVAFYNIKEALINNIKFQEEFESFFNKYNSEKDIKIKEDEDKNIQGLFYCWSKFYNQKSGVSPKIFKYSEAIFSDEKHRLTARFLKERDNMKDTYGLIFNIELNRALNRSLVITCEVEGQYILNSIVIARDLVKNVLASNSYFSAKKTFIDMNINSIIYIPLVLGNPINQKSVEIHLFNLEDELEENFSKQINFLNDIKKEIEQYYGFEYWNLKIGLIKSYELIRGEIHNISFFNNQLNEIELLLSEDDLLTQKIYDDYKDTVSILLKKNVVDRLNDLEKIQLYFKDENLYSNILEFLNNFGTDSEVKIIEEDFKILKEEVANYYYIFSDRLIIELNS